LENIAKKFKEGQRIKVISGADTGKTGIVLKVSDKFCEIWTDNQNAIRVNKKNL
jgi:ribosomal protein L24